MKLMRTIYILLLLAVVGGADIRPASAQCGPNDKVYIDPRLLPSPSRMTRENLNMILSNNHIDPAMKQWYLRQYMTQINPIEVPYKGGRVLINPQNPCIQQYIPN